MHELLLEVWLRQEKFLILEISLLGGLIPWRWGAVLGWLWVIEAHQKLGLELPVNIKMIFEGMEGLFGLFEAGWEPECCALFI